MNTLWYLTIITLCITVVSTTTPDEMQRVIKRVANRLRVEASLRLNLAEMKALASATSIAHGVCIVRAGAPALFEINTELKRLTSELEREAVTAVGTDLTDLDLANYESTVTQRIERPINNIVDNRIAAVNSCA